MLTRILVAVVVLWAHGATAQDLPATLRPRSFTFTADRQTPPTPSRGLNQIDVALFSYGATAGADWAVTAVCLKARCSPHDPIGLAVFGIDNPKIAVPLGVAIDGAVIYSVRRWIQPKHATTAQTIYLALSAVRLVIIAGRVSDLRKRTPTN